MADYEAMAKSLQSGKANEVHEQVETALEEGIPAREILDNGLMPAMNVVGEKFRKNEIYVPEVLIAARAMKAGTDLLRPYFVSGEIKPVGTAIIGTVKGDLHDIGKNLVKMMMEGKGFEVIDLGTDVAPEVFIESAQENEARIICCSALLTTTMTKMAEVVKAAQTSGMRDRFTIMVGGAPVTEAYKDSIEADIYRPDAASAAQAALEAIGTAS